MQTYSWSNAPWAKWFDSYDSATGEVSSPPFSSDASFFQDPTQNQPDGTLIHLVAKGKTGFMQGAAWASESCAREVAAIFPGSTIVNLAPYFYGGWGFNQPQFGIELPNGVRINPGEIARYFINHAGPTGGSAVYLDWWLRAITSA